MNKSTVVLFAVLLVVVVALLTPESAWAGTGGGDEFNEVYERVKGWAQGGLGKLIATLFLLVGIGAGVVARSVAAAIPALAAALFLFFGPKVIESIMTVTVQLP
jgi:conjugal transfer pilus assembly protein TraA